MTSYERMVELDQRIHHLAKMKEGVFLQNPRHADSLQVNADIKRRCKQEREEAEKERERINANL